MNNLSKIVLTGSIVLGAALFTIGCGEDSACCEPTTPPRAVIAGFPTNGTLEANEHILTVNGVSSSDDGTITAYEWTIDDVFASNQQSPTLDLGAPGRHKVCLEVTDNDGLKNMTCEYITVPALTGPSPIISPTTIKSGCPLDGSSSVSHSASGEIRAYKWTLNTLDSATVSTTATYTVPNPTTATKVCLTVTDSNGESNGVCQDIVPHAAPVAVLHVYEDQANQNEIVDGGVLRFGDTLNLTCAGSHDDCPVPESGRSIPQNGDTTNGTCSFNGSSYQSTAADCSVLPQSGVVYENNTTQAPYYYREDCKLTGELTQTSDTAGAVSVHMCGQPVFNCVRFWVDVTDEFGGTSRATKTFRVQ